MPLNPDQRAELEAIMRRERERLLREIRNEVEQSRRDTFEAVAGEVTDSGDEAVADLLSDLNNAEVARDVRELREIDAALLRLEGGTYGCCASCGLDVGIARLRAHPAAMRCIACQNAYERSHAHPNVPKL